MTNHRLYSPLGFTLIELMVVMALILLIGGMGVAFLPTIGDTARQATSASMLQQWLLTAKQKALRDQVPCGIRLFPYVDPVSGKAYANLARDCQYIEQPDDYPPSVPDLKSGAGMLSLTLPTAAQPVAVATINNLRVSNTQVMAGDYLELLGNGLMHQITFVKPGASTQLGLATAPPYLQTSSPPYALKNITQYRIIRAPRVTGDDVLQFPDPVKIDLRTNIDYSKTLSAGGAVTLPKRNGDGSIDILFAPSGAVISAGITTDTINLWVRDCETNPQPAPAAADPLNGQQTIVAIHVRSGLTTTHPPAGPNDPYKFVMDGRK